MKKVLNIQLDLVALNEKQYKELLGFKAWLLESLYDDCDLIRWFQLTEDSDDD